MGEVSLSTDGAFEGFVDIDSGEKADRFTKNFIVHEFNVLEEMDANFFCSLGADYGRLSLVCIDASGEASVIDRFTSAGKGQSTGVFVRHTFLPGTNLLVLRCEDVHQAKLKISTDGQMDLASR